MSAKKKFSVWALLSAGFLTALMAAFFSSRQTQAASGPSTGASGAVPNSSPSPDAQSTKLAQANAPAVSPSPDLNNPIHPVAAPMDSDSQRASSDGKDEKDEKDMADEKTESPPPVGELIDPKTTAIDPSAGDPPVELLKAANLRNINGPVVSPETK